MREQTMPEETTLSIREVKINFIKMLMKDLAEDMMSSGPKYLEIQENRINKLMKGMLDKKYITKDDVSDLNHHLNVLLGRTPEQINNRALGIINVYIKNLIADIKNAGPKDIKIFEEKTRGYFQTMLDSDQITQEDFKKANSDVDFILGRNPEQIREAKLGIINIYLKNLAKDTKTAGPSDNRLFEEIVRGHFQTMLDSGHITQEDFKKANDDVNAILIGKT